MFSIHILHNLQCSQTINEKYKNLSWGPTQIQMIPKTNLEIQLLSLTYIQSFIEISFCLFSYHVTNGQIERHTNKQTNYLENRPVKSCKYLRLVNDTFEEILHYLEKNTHLESVIFRRKILIK